MNIGFEAKRFFTNYTGLGNYSRFVIDALSEENPSDKLYLFTPRKVDHEENRQILSRGNVAVVAPSGLLAMPGLSALWRTWAMSKNPAVKSIDIFHGLSQELPMGLPGRMKKVVTVHDLIFLRYPQFYNSVDVSIYTRKVRAACEHADRIVAISHQTAEDIQSFLEIKDPSRIDVVYQGCHPIFKKHGTAEERSAVKKKYALPDKYILNVGTIEERKNLATLISALGMVPASERLPLVVVGRQTPYYAKVQQEIKRSKLENEVLFLNNVNFQDLPSLYQQSQFFIYPSFFEGFGIPLIEAMTSGVPVITSVGSCFKEAAGPGAVYVDPSSAENLAAEIRSLQANEVKRRKLIEDGRSYIARFEPGVIAKQLSELYRNLVSKSNF